MKKATEYEMLDDFYKKEPTDTIWWTTDVITPFDHHLFSFDKVIVFDLFWDYPHNLTPEQKEIFDRENPYWAKFMKGHCK